MRLDDLLSTLENKNPNEINAVTPVTSAMLPRVTGKPLTNQGGNTGNTGNTPNNQYQSDSSAETEIATREAEPLAEWDRIRDLTARGCRRQASPAGRLAQAEFGAPGPDGKQSVTWREPEPRRREDFPPEHFEIVHFSEYRLKSGRRVSFDLAVPKDRYDGFELIWLLDAHGNAEARP